jgi:hypothetical protein
MALTHAQAQVALASMLDLPQTGDWATHLTNFLNRGGRRVWEARRWFGRDVSTIVFTAAPYRTGTATFTLAGTSVSGTGTTWTAAMTGRKIALATGSPWYIFTRSSDTAGTIPTGGYAEATATDSTYVIFADEYDLAATAETILDVSIFHSRMRGSMERMTEEAMDDLYFTNPTVGTPLLWAPTLSTTAGTRRFRVAPIPDAIYRLRVRYLAAYTDLSAAGDFCVLGANRERAWLLASALEAQRAGDSRPVTNDDEVQAAIEECWQKEQAQAPMVIRRSPVGGGGSRGVFYVNDDNVVGL